ncbi:MAG: DMT family transporter [Pseudomonadota bacterium]
MNLRDRLFLSAVLVVLGAGWGLTMPLTKVAVSTGFGHYGLIFWQLVIGTALMGMLNLVRGKGLPLTRAGLVICVVVSLVGTLVPNSASYQAAVHVPSGVLSILLSLVPMFAFPIALALRLDRFSWRRLAGLGAGLAGVLMLVAPGVSAQLGTPIFWLLVAMVAGLCYALEGNIVAKWGTAGLDAIQVLFAASALGAAAVLPVALASGQFIPPADLTGRAGKALIAASVAHTSVYALYVWLVGRAGPVFSVQASYLVTGFGILWAKLILDEAYPPVVWASLAAMFLGMYLVQPRPASAGAT